jgi:DNA polymerase III epsilon subunit-like protein
MKYLFFDTETTGLPKNYNAPVKDVDNWPRLVQLAWILTSASGEVEERFNCIIRPDGWVISEQAAAIHGITQAVAEMSGVPIAGALKRFARLLYDKGCTVVAHNIYFDYKVVGAEFERLGWPVSFGGVPMICTMEASTNFCQLPNNNGYSSYKWPKLQELHRKLFAMDFTEAHNAAADIDATRRCFFELVKLKVIQP